MYYTAKAWEKLLCRPLILLRQLRTRIPSSGRRSISCNDRYRRGLQVRREKILGRHEAAIYGWPPSSGHAGFGERSSLLGGLVYASVLCVTRPGLCRRFVES